MEKHTRHFFSFLIKVLKSKFFILFVFAVVLRAIPEFLSGVYPVGFDALAGYVPSVLALPNTTPMKLFGWVYSPLAIYLLWFIRVLTGGDIYLLLKIVGPVFYGLFTVSFYFMLSHGLGWKGKKSFVVSLLFLLQPAIMRTGWDQLREELGLILMFVLLGVIKLDLVKGIKSKPLLFLGLSILIVFSHQLVAILFFVVVIFQLLNVLIQKRKMDWSALAVIIPSASLFVWQLYGQFVNPAFDTHFVPLSLPNGTGNFAFTNYFLSDPRFVGGDYFTILAYVCNLSLYVVVPLIPLAFKGFFKDKVFLPMLAWLLASSYSITIFPWYALSYYWFWTFLLPIPLSVYAGHGLDRMGVFNNGKHSRKLVMGILLLGIVAFSYVSSETIVGYPLAYTYMPPGLVKSCVDFEDICDIKQAFDWTNENIPLNAVIVVPEKLQGFASVQSRDDIRIWVAPALLNFNDISYTIEDAISSYFVIYYWSEMGDYDEQTTIQLWTIGNIAVYHRIT
jgi:hypothetical protein